VIRISTFMEFLERLFHVRADKPESWLLHWRLSFKSWCDNWNLTSEEAF